jgi:probable DNA metabolism protein
MGSTKVDIRPHFVSKPLLFGTTHMVETDRKKADRVWRGLRKQKNGQRAANRIYKSFLSELPGTENTIYQYVRLIFSSSGHEAQDYSNPVVLKITQTVKKVGREKHRMDAFVRFRLTRDGVYVSTISPDFNVLPLIATHFKARYADQPWLILDVKRGYGIRYDLKDVHVAKLEDPRRFTDGLPVDILDPAEVDFTRLWKQYFKCTNIQARKNTALHLRHVPGRYWKYLSEKQP